MTINWKRVVFLTALFYCWYCAPTLVQGWVDKHRCIEALTNVEGEIQGFESQMWIGNLMSNVLAQEARAMKAWVKAVRVCQIE